MTSGATEGAKVQDYMCMPVLSSRLAIKAMARIGVSYRGSTTDRLRRHTDVPYR